MQNIQFDITALVPPPAPPSAPPPAQPPGSGSNTRFEDHLGQATRTPRPGSSDSQQDSPGRESRSTENQATAKRDNSQNTSGSSGSPTIDARQPSMKQNNDGSSEESADGDDNASADAAAAVAAVDGNHPQAVLKDGKPGARAVNETDRTKLSGKAVKGTTTKPGQQTRDAAQKGNESETTLKDRPGLPGADAPADASTDAPADASTAASTEGRVDPISGVAEKADSKSDQASAAAVAGVASAAAQKSRPARPTTAATGSAESSDTAVQPAQSGEQPEPAAAAKRKGGAKGAEPSGTTAAQRPATEPTTAATPSEDKQAATANTTVADLETSKDQSKPSTNAPAGDRNDKVETRSSPPPALLAARHSNANPSDDRAGGLTEAERVRFVQRVASAFRSLGNEGGEVRLRLSPPELGAMRLELSVHDGVMRAHLETETSTARSLLLDNLPALRDRLAEQNIKVERFDVDVRDERRQTAGDQFAGQSDQGRQGLRGRQRAFENRSASPTPVITPRGPVTRGDAGELNIVI